MPGLKVEDLSVLSVKEILHLLQGNLTVSRSIQWPKETLINYIIKNTNPTLSESIQDAIQLKINKKKHNREQQLEERKHKRVEDQHSQHTACKLEEVLEDTCDTSKFLELPSKAQIKNCY